MLQTTESQAVNTIVEGTATVGVIAFFSEAMKHTLPWLGLAVPIILLDLLYGIRAAKFRGDNVRWSTAIRRTVDKTVGYIMWCAAAVMMKELFEINWLDKAVLGLVFGNELVSVFGNYLETKGIDFSFAGFWRLVFRKGAEKVGVDVSEEEAKEIIKPRDSRGRFVKKS
jgi:hypothetical protein